MNSKWYWIIRQKYRNLKFQIKKAAFRLNERKESSERLSSFSRIVIRTLLVQVAINFYHSKIFSVCNLETETPTAFDVQ